MLGRLSLSLVLTAAVITPTTAQHYDVYYVLPAEKGTTGVDVGLASAAITGLGEASDLNVLGKYSVSDDFEVGARAVLGLMNDGRDDLSTIEVGAKLGTQEMMALTAALLVPVGDADDPGISVGAMKTKEMESGMAVNAWLQATLLKGYHADGIGLDLLLEPAKPLGDKLTGYLDVLVRTNTDSIGDNLGINLGPNIDITLNEKAVINAGVTIGIAGDAKQDDIGLVVTLVAGL